MPFPIAIPIAMAVGGAIMKGVSGARAANSARDAQINAANQANQGLTDWRSQLQGMYSPYQQQGMQANNMLSSLAMDPNYWKGYGGFNSSASQASRNYVPMGAMGTQPAADTTRGGLGSLEAPVRVGGGAPPSDPSVVAMPYGRLGSVEGGGIGITPNGTFGAGEAGTGYSRQGLVNAGGQMGGMTGIAPMLEPGYGGDPNMPPRIGTPMDPGIGGGQNQNPFAGLSTAPPERTKMASFGGMKQYEKPWNADQVMNDPGYGFAQQEAQDALAQQLASLGLSQSGGAVKQAGEVAGNVANRYYNDAYQRMANDRQFWANEGQRSTANRLAQEQMNLGAQGQAYNQYLQGAQFGQQGSQFNQQMGLQRDQFGLQNRQFDWSQVLGDRQYDMDLRNQQLGLLGQLSGQGFSATNNYGQLGTGIQTQIGNNILGQGNAQAASAMYNPFIGIGGTLAGVGGAMLGGR